MRVYVRVCMLCAMCPCICVACGARSACLLLFVHACVTCLQSSVCDWPKEHC